MSDVFGMNEPPGGAMFANPPIRPPVPPAPPAPPTSPFQVLQWLVGVAGQLGINPMQLGSMIARHPETAAAVLDSAGVPSPDTAGAETADILGAPTVGEPNMGYPEQGSYAALGMTPPPEMGAPVAPSAPAPAGTAPTDVNTLDLTTPVPAPPGGGAVPGVGGAPAATGPAANGLQQKAQSLQSILSGVVAPPNPQVQAIGSPSAPSHNALTPQDLNAIVAQVLSVAKPSVAGLTLGGALPQGRRTA